MYYKSFAYDVIEKYGQKIIKEIRKWKNSLKSNKNNWNQFNFLPLV